MRGLSLSSGRRLVLDGGLATQLESAGADLSGELWSARLLSEAPQEIKRAHDEFVLAGADVITTASYQCSVPLLMRVLGVDDETAAGLISKSVDIARSSASAAAEPTATAATAACRRVVLVAASIGPYGACLADGSEYNGHYKKLPVTDLVQWHQRRFDLLCDAKPDVLAFETIPCRNEIAALCSLLHQRPSARAWLSIACNSGTTLNSGELVADAIDDLERLDTHNQIEAVGVNCTAPQHIDALLAIIQSHTSRPCIVYPNSGENWDALNRDWISVPHKHGLNSKLLRSWASQVQVIGGCCRVGPAQVAQIKKIVDEYQPAATVEIGGLGADLKQSMLQKKPTNPSLKTRATKVILDVDTGIDDAWAILLAFQCPELDVIGVTTVVGNANVDLVTAATLRSLDHAGAPQDVPVSKGASSPLKEKCHFCPHIHGTDALGDLTDPPLPPSKRSLDPRSAVDFILETLAEAQEPITIVALAPLTNLALAVQQNPDLCAKKIERILWMGGSAFAGGNYSAWAEANAAYDPEAADIVLRSDVLVTMYPWDVYLAVEYDSAEISGIEESTPWATLAARLLRREMTHWGTSAVQIGDAGVVAALIAMVSGDSTLVSSSSSSYAAPSGAATLQQSAVMLTQAGGGASSGRGGAAVTCEGPGVSRVTYPVSVELEGLHTRGMTVVDQRPFVVPPDIPRGPEKTEVIVRVNPTTLKRIFSEYVLGSHGPPKVQ